MFEKDFPKLSSPLSKKTSEPTQQYNCVAWAFEDNTRWWWPKRGGYWPTAYTGRTVQEAFEDLLAAGGWEPTGTQTFESGFKRIAIYSKLQDGQPTHVARQLLSGLWSSKLGQDMDLTHDLQDLAGPTYGTMISVFRKSTI